MLSASHRLVGRYPKRHARAKTSGARRATALCRRSASPGNSRQLGQVFFCRLGTPIRRKVQTDCPYETATRSVGRRSVKTERHRTKAPNEGTRRGFFCARSTIGLLPRETKRRPSRPRVHRECRRDVLVVLQFYRRLRVLCASVSRFVSCTLLLLLTRRIGAMSMSCFSPSSPSSSSRAAPPHRRCRREPPIFVSLPAGRGAGILFPPPPPATVKSSGPAPTD